MANNLDEIVNTQTNTRTEIHSHERRDDIVGFDRGNVNIKIGNKMFTADVLLGRKNDGNRLFYDLANLKEAVPHPHKDRQTADTLGRGTGTASDNINISQTRDNVNSQSARGFDNDTTSGNARLRLLREREDTRNRREI